MNELDKAQGPLAGYRVLDMTAFISGPFGSQQLGDLGADVIKIETPRGDETREKGNPPAEGMGPGFANLNRNKRSIVLDLKSHEGRDRLHKLVATADVLFHNMRPDAIQRLGASYEMLKEIKPDLVYCQIVGFSSDGPYAGAPAFEDVVQGISGYSDLQGAATGTPAFAAFALVDSVAGIVAAQSIIAALLHRERTGQGQFVEVPMLETAIALTMPSNMWDRTYDPEGALGYPRYLTPNRRPFATKDGFICTVFGSDKHFQAFFSAAGRAEILEDERFATNQARSVNSDALWGAVAECFASGTTAEWVALLRGADLPGMPMNRIEDLFTDPHLQATGFFRQFQVPEIGYMQLISPPVKYSATPAGIHRLPPRLSEHTDEIIREIDENTDDS